MAKTKDKQSQHLQLLLNFTDPTPAVLRSLATLMEIATSSRVSGTAALPVPEGGEKDDCGNPHAKPDDDGLRKRIRQLAGCVSVAKKQDWHEVWVLAYHAFYKETGKHPVVESVRAGLPAHLDYVFTNPEWPGILHNVLDGMLLDGKS